ncbi:MAG: polysaccharide deacetylase family protein [Beijerinckiaceae bacterium]|nr:polysaccharide deacetylase family protein [Beijerinckiaceae bacterium]
MHQPRSARKRLKIACLYVAKTFGLFSLVRLATGSGIRILAYHGIWLADDGFAGDAMFMRAATFKARLDCLIALGYPVISLDDAVDALSGRRAIAPASVVITMDDGWFGSYAEMMPALLERSMPATLYCDTKHVLVGCPIAHVMASYCRKLTPMERIGESEEALYRDATDVSRPIRDRLESAKAFCRAVGIDPEDYIQRRAFDYMSASELRDAQRYGVSIELHTHNHNLGDLSAGVVTEEIALNRQHLAALLNADPASFNHFCYPSGVSSADVAEVLDAIGIGSSTTTMTGLAFKGVDLQMLPRFLDGDHVTMIEFEAQMSGFSELVTRLLRRRKTRGEPVMRPMKTATHAEGRSDLDREPIQLA